MSTLLLHLSGNRTFNHTVFPPNLFVFDDLLLYKKRRLFGVKEITISYNQISQISLNKGIFFATLELVTTGTDDILIKYVSKKLASQAKRIIDQKIYYSHAKHHETEELKKPTPTHIEKSLTRLKELNTQGHLSDQEYEKKKRSLLNQL